jgi:hypothetical protein
MGEQGTLQETGEVGNVPLDRATINARALDQDCAPMDVMPDRSVWAFPLVAVLVPRSKRGAKPTCSDRCAGLARKAARSRYSAAQSRTTSEVRAAARAGRTCLDCGAPLKAQRSTMLYCSPRCRMAGHRASKPSRDSRKILALA